MIARARVLLPKTVLVPLEEPDPVDLDLGAYRAKLFRPYRSELADVAEELPLSERPRLLRRAEAPTQPLIRMNDEQVVAADVIQVDFSAEDFDRRLGTSNDPPVSLLFEVVNGFLARYRTLARGFQITALAPINTMWRIEYLNDDGSDLEPQEGLARALVGASFTVELMGLPNSLWDRIHELPANYRSTPWDELILDALARLPHVGAAVVLGFSALEVRIEAALNDLARLYGVRPEVWEWINDRGPKEPAILEQFDSLLTAVTGRSLKEDNRLWDGFQNLRKARNSFVHDGIAVLGGIPVAPPRATELLQLAGEIIDWVDELLPEALRRPRHDVEMRFEADTIVVAPTPPPAQTDAT